MKQPYLKIEASCYQNPNCYFVRKRLLFTILTITNISKYPVTFRNNWEVGISDMIYSIDRKEKSFAPPVPQDKGSEIVIMPNETVQWGRPTDPSPIVEDMEKGKAEAIIELILYGVMYVEGQRIEFEEKRELHVVEKPENDSEEEIPVPKPAQPISAYPGQPCPKSGIWTTHSMITNKSVTVNAGEPMPGQKYDKAGNGVIWYWHERNNS